MSNRTLALFFVSLASACSSSAVTQDLGNAAGGNTNTSTSSGGSGTATSPGISPISNTSIGGKPASTTAVGSGGSASTTPSIGGSSSPMVATGGSTSRTNTTTTVTSVGGAGGAIATTSTGTTSSGPLKTTSDLIGPGGPITSGAKNGTHKDLWIGLFSYPRDGENIIGAWYTFKWGTSTCSTTKPSAGNNATYGGSPLCASGGGCTGTTPGDALGFSLCDVAGINTATWPQMKQLITTGGLSTTGKSTFGQCNGGAKITSVSWTMANGTTTPAGMSVEFMGADDKPIGKVSELPEGTTTVPVSGFDSSKVSAIHFQFDGKLVKTWKVCFEKITLSYQ